MKNNFNFLILLFIFIVGCVCVGSSFAADVTVDNVDDVALGFTHDDSSQNVEINNLQADEGSYTELQDKVNNANPDSTIKLTKDYKFDNATESNMFEGISINKSLTIDGQGHTIDGDNLARGFYAAETVILKNINFKNNYYDGDGGAIYINSDNSTVDNCSFTDCEAIGDGGAIYWFYSDYSAVSACSFTNCVSGDDDGGAISWDECDYCAVSACSFTNCNAYFYGGAINWGGGDYGAVSACSFTNCSAYWGGAIFEQSCNYCNVSDCSFINCFAEKCGGAIYWFYSDCGNVGDCSFTDCSACDWGSAVMIRGSSLSIVDSTCTSLDGDKKAPIYNDGTILSPVVITTNNGEIKNVALGDKVNLTGTITASGIPVAGGTLCLVVNGHYFYNESDEAGLYFNEYTVDFEGIKPVNAAYNNSTKDLQYVIKGKLIVMIPTFVTIDPVNGQVGDNISVTAHVVDRKGNSVLKGIVVFTFNGKDYKVTIKEGIATFDVILSKAGTHVLSALFEGDDVYESSSASIDVVVTNKTNPDPDPNPNPNPDLNPNQNPIPDVNCGVENMENTGNPLLVLLIALTAIGLELFRRKV